VPTFDLALWSDTGRGRPDNQDSCGRLDEGSDRVLFAVADGVGGYEGGKEASGLAVEVTLDTFRHSPPHWGAEKRVYRAVQQGNIAVHDRAMIVPELRRMRTTMTAVVVDGRELYASHVGDCRLYLARGGALVQLTKDHTVAAERGRFTLSRDDPAAARAGSSTLTRCLGGELIVAVDRIARTLEAGDVLLLCSDGLYNVLDERELHTLTTMRIPDEACQALVEAANEEGSPDNVTAAVLRMADDLPPVDRAEETGVRGRLARILGR
jgi:PPM family protein phosphatase